MIFFSVFYEKTEQHYLHFSEYELWIVLFGKRNLNIDMITMHRVHGRIDFYLFFLYMNDTTHVNPLRFISNYSHCYILYVFSSSFQFQEWIKNLAINDKYHTIITRRWKNLWDTYERRDPNNSSVQRGVSVLVLFFKNPKIFKKKPKLCSNLHKYF